MNAKSVLRLKGEVALWATEIRSVVSACRRLVEYFGSKKELASWDAALKAPLEWVEIVVAHTPRRKRGDPLWPRYAGDVTFRCAESTAKILSPLVEIVGGPWAHFVRMSQDRSEGGTRAAALSVWHVLREFRRCGDAATMAGMYRHLAPAEWKSCFPE